MSKEELREIIANCCNEVVFNYNGKPSGVTSTVYESIPTFQVWHGKKIKEYSDVDKVMNDKFYSGKSIADLINQVQFDII